MMGLDERFFYFILGCILGAVFGFILGYRAKWRSQEDQSNNVQEESSGRYRPIMLGIAVLITAVAAVVAQVNSSESDRNQKQQQAVLQCTQAYLSQTIKALNERTTYSAEQLQASVDQQRAQNKFIQVALQDPPLESNRVEQALREYFKTGDSYVDLATKTRDRQLANPYPTDDQLTRCVAKSQEDS